jgi:hypothetical protein
MQQCPSKSPSKSSTHLPVPATTDSQRIEPRRMLTDHDPTPSNPCSICSTSAPTAQRLGHTPRPQETSHLPAKTPQVIKKARKLGLVP